MYICTLVRENCQAQWQPTDTTVFSSANLFQFFESGGVQKILLLFCLIPRKQSVKTILPRPHDDRKDDSSNVECWISNSLSHEKCLTSNLFTNHFKIVNHQHRNVMFLFSFFDDASWKLRKFASASATSYRTRYLSFWWK